MVIDEYGLPIYYLCEIKTKLLGCAYCASINMALSHGQCPFEFVHKHKNCTTVGKPWT